MGQPLLNLCFVVQLLSRAWLGNPMNRSMLRFAVLPHLQEPAQTHVHWVGDAIQPSHPLSSSSPSAFYLPNIRVFSNASALCIRWPKYLLYNWGKEDPQLWLNQGPWVTAEKPDGNWELLVFTSASLLQ